MTTDSVEGASEPFLGVVFSAGMGCSFLCYLFLDLSFKGLLTTDYVEGASEPFLGVVFPAGIETQEERPRASRRNDGRQSTRTQDEKQAQ